ncbi:MAG TPA: hypothetical protein VFX39_04600, partial [Gemmatimonadaceae bacterium]|nr:hypothetical protein [Gemmatimonadaceae bacterium]
AFVTLGAGQFVGSFLSGWTVERKTIATATGAPTHDWYSIWLVPAVGALGVLLIFAFLFRPARSSEEPAAAEGAPASAPA